jgi:hypothetical protein
MSTSHMQVLDMRVCVGCTLARLSSLRKRVCRFRTRPARKRPRTTRKCPATRS